MSDTKITMPCGTGKTVLSVEGGGWSVELNKGSKTCNSCSWHVRTSQVLAVTATASTGQTLQTVTLFVINGRGKKMNEKLKPCRICRGDSVMEYWHSGGSVVAVRCDNPDRPDACSEAFYYSRSNDPKEAIRKWNEFQGGKNNA